MVAGDSPRSAAVGPPIRAAAAKTEPVSLATAMGALEPVEAVWTGPGEPTIVTSGRVETLTAGGEGRFHRIRELAAERFDQVEGDVPRPARPRFLGGFSFFGTETLSALWAGFEPAAFVLPATQLVSTESGTWVTVIDTEREADSDRLSARLASVLSALEDGAAGPTSPEETNGARQITAETFRSDPDVWQSRVRTITETIRSGGLRKAVLAQGLDLTVDRPLRPGPVLQSLGETYPDCYRFAFHGGMTGPETAARPFFFGASPEQLVGKQRTALTTEALAGTVARGADADSDAELEAQLRSDPKILEEHDLVVESIEQQLDAVTDGARVGDRGVRKLATVQHLHAPIWASIDPGTHVLDLVEALHPTPAVGGLPPDAAKAVIRETESVDRGWYAAPVGWFDADGNGSFAVGIRSALARENRATLFAGNGIVADSDPEAEWDEVRLKFSPVRTALR